MPPVPESLIAELELAVKDDSVENRTRTLRRVTDLFLNDKAAGLEWSTAEALLRNRHSNHKIPDQIIELARGDYDRPSVATAQRTLRFMQVREAAK
jgi:hypothetical protein